MDPLCGWCYGFSDVMQQMQEKYKGEYAFTVIPGGMITGSRVAPISEMAKYILNSYKGVEGYSGVKFGEPYLDLLRDGKEISNSEPSCRAIHVFKQKQEEKALDFAHELQLKIFRDGKSWNDESTFREVAEQFGLKGDEFIAETETEESRYGTQQEFQWVQAAGITGFPCTILEKGGKYYMLAQGYKPLEMVEEVLENINRSEQ
jgi:putative protein-disulfide isomerase